MAGADLGMAGAECMYFYYASLLSTRFLGVYIAFIRLSGFRKGSIRLLEATCTRNRPFPSPFSPLYWIQ